MAQAHWGLKMLDQTALGREPCTNALVGYWVVLFGFTDQFEITKWALPSVPSEHLANVLFSVRLYRGASTSSEPQQSESGGSDA